MAATAATAATKSAKWIEKVNRKLFIGGNWKCNGTIKSAHTLVNDTVNKIVFDQKKMEVLVSPIFVHLFEVQKILNKKVHLSAQNISPFASGPFTGEISAQQLKDFGINWTLIGHSERRTYFKESDNVPFALEPRQIIATKARIALEHGLKVVFCIGEKLSERESGRTLDVCLSQIAAVNSMDKGDDT